MKDGGGKEHELRGRLGIPDDARRVLVFAESSHWDPDWLLTAEEYYRLRIRRILEDMMRWLEREPGRVYSIECLFFFKMFWDRNPDKRNALRHWVNEGRIRLSGSGITTPDTILPDLEALIRDYLHGQQWLRENGMRQEPRLAYLPDNFGHTPFLPSILNSLGYEYSAFSRIDGIFFPGSDYFNAASYPLAGSSAELLLRRHRSADFVWKNRDGSELLCHLNPYTYGQGDTIAHAGLARWMGLVIGLPLATRSPAAMAKRIEGHVRRLDKYARTPYLFCPIGFDFNQPIPGLLRRLREYNARYFPHTGVYSVNASLEDYMDLVSAHRDDLPVVDLDPNPYFMGFYSSRPEAKQLCRGISATLTAAEKLLASSEGAEGKDSRREEAWREIRDAWDEYLMANHHDFITGTSPQRVWEKEQRPLLLAWSARAKGILRKAASLADSGTLYGEAACEPMPSYPAWSLERGVLRVETHYFRLELDEAVGGCMTYWADTDEGTNLLSGPANDVVAYEDRGGLWRMGNEFRGGVFREKARCSASRATICAEEDDGCLSVTVCSSLEGNEILRRLWIRRDSPIIWMRLEGAASGNRTVTCRFPTILRPREITMGVTGGLLERPLAKLYHPTFWAAERFAFIRDPALEKGLAAFPGGPSVVSCDAQGRLELVALRSASRERAFYVLPLLAHPARGRDFGVQSLDYALLLTGAGDWRRNRLHVISRHALAAPWADPLRFPLGGLSDEACITDDENVEVTALKRALRGEGLIVRLYSPVTIPGKVAISLRCGRIERATACDARERDLEELEVIEGRALVPMRGNIASVRLLP